MAGVNRTIHSWFWHDPFVRTLNPSEKLAFLYFITNMHTTLCGVYEIPWSLVVYEAEISEEDIVSFLEKAKTANKMLYNKELGVIYIRNYIKYQTYSRPTFLFNANKQLGELSFPTQTWLEQVGAFDELLEKTGRGNFVNKNTEIKEVLDFFAASWNGKMSKPFTIDWDKGQKILRPIMKQYKKDRVIEYIRLFFLSNDKVFVDGEYSLNLLHLILPKIKNVETIETIGQEPQKIIINTPVKEKKSTAFVKPTLKEIQDYCKERKNKVDAQTFLDFYIAKNWFIGKSKMIDWKACVRTWEKRDTGFSGKVEPVYKQPVYVPTPDEGPIVPMPEAARAALKEFKIK